jgi:ribosome maturation factor RimP
VTDQHLNERVRAVVQEPLANSGFDVVDVECQGSVLRVTVDLLVRPDDDVDLLVRPDGDHGDDVADGDEPGAGPSGGIDMDGVTRATRLVSDLLDQHDLVGERTTLEVSSPGIERPLRTPEHFRRFVGSEVAVKLRPSVQGERRLTGVLEAADGDGVVVAGRRLAYVDIDRARTVFVWPPRAEKAGGQKTAAKKIGRAS